MESWIAFRKYLGILSRSRKYKERSILVARLPKFATRCRPSNIQTKIGSLNFLWKISSKWNEIFHDFCVSMSKRHLVYKTVMKWILKLNITYWISRIEWFGPRVWCLKFQSFKSVWKTLICIWDMLWRTKGNTWQQMPPFETMTTATTTTFQTSPTSATLI